MSFVMLSVLDEPLSDAAARSGVPGAVGATVSTENWDDVFEAELPALSVAVAVMVLLLPCPIVLMLLVVSE